jgi:hypothetical protein
VGPIRIDLGDVQLLVEARVKGLTRLRTYWRVGAARPTTEADRVVNPRPQRPATGRIDVSMDLLDDQKVALSLGWTDDVGNSVPTPDDAAATYTVDDATVINLTDNGDGTAEAAATGQLGTATVHVDATGGGQTVSGDLQLVVVTSAAARVSIVAGTPEHV